MKKIIRYIATSMMIMSTFVGCTYQARQPDTEANAAVEQPQSTEDSIKRNDIAVDNKTVALNKGRNFSNASVGQLIGNGHVATTTSAVITADNVSLFIDSGAVSRDVDISIVATTEEHSGDIPDHITNLTTDRAVYRMLPDGQQFNRDITIAMGYDSTALPYGYTVDDIYTFFYNEETHLWQQVERDSVDTQRQIVYSRTNHFTDYINGVLKMPESSDAMAYTPTSIKGLKAADPMEGITLIAPPTANNQGTANLSYPLVIPSGRHGMQPSLSVTYNSAGGSGTLGLGWTLSISEISVDTRRGVPMFDQVRETEAYILDGEEIVTSHIDDNGQLRLNKPVYKTAYKDRDTTFDTVRYYLRREGAFNRIQRVETTTKTYSWIVTDKSGTKYYYGTDSASRLCDKKGNITRWLLSHAEDTYGNTITYHWTKRTFTHSNLNPGTQVLLQRINYTGTHTESGHYNIRFYYSDTKKHDASVSARSGVMEADAFLLDHIDEDFDGTHIRSYYFGYRQGVFSKTLLCNIVEASPKAVEDEGYGCDGGNNQYINNTIPDVLESNLIHTGDDYTKYKINCESDFYANNIKILNIAGEPIFSRDVYDRCASTCEKCEYYTFNEHRFEYSDIPTSLLSGEMSIANRNISSDDIEGPLFLVRGTPGSIEGSGTKSWNIGGGVDVGFGYNTFLKNVTLGGNYNYTSNTTEGLLTLVDLNGDGLTDKIYKRDDDFYYRLRDANNTNYFGSEHSISGMDDFLYSAGYSHSLGVEGAVGTNIGVNFGVNWTFGEDPVTNYLSDIDGDGLPDLVKEGNVYYNRINQYPNKVFVAPQSDVRYDTLSICGDIIIDTIYVGESVISDLFDDYDNDTVYYTICHNEKREQKIGGRYIFYDTVICIDTFVVNSYRAPKPYNPNLENVRMWKAPYTGYVKIENHAKMLRNHFNDGDGVRIIIQKDTTIIYNQTIWLWDELFDYVDGIYVEQGSRLFFRMLSGETRIGDRALWNPTIRYLQVETPGVDLNDSIGIDGLNKYVYSYNKDFLLSGVQQIMMPYRSRIRLTSKASTLNALPNSVSVLYSVLVNGHIVRTDTLTDNQRTIYSDTTYEVEKNDKVQIRMSCSEPINWGAIEARCHLRIIENRSSDPFDRNYACVDTLSIPGDTVFFYEYYPQIEKVTNVAPNGEDAIFGTMYRHWGQFSYKSPDGNIRLDTSLLHLDAIYNMQQSDSTLYTNIDNNDTININGEGEESSVSIGGQTAYNPLSSSFFNMQPDFKNGCWSAYSDYASIGRDTLSNAPHPADGMTQEQSDSIEHACLSPIYSPNAVAISKNNKHKSWGASASGHINVGIDLCIGGSYTESKTRQLSDMTDLNGDGMPDVLSETKIQYTQPQGGLSLLEGRHCIGGYYLDSTANVIRGGSFSGTAVFATQLPAKNPRRAHTSLSGTVGANLGGMYTSGKTIVSWTDINGDGLLDKIVNKGDTLHYFQNLGYAFMGARCFSDMNGVQESYNEGLNGGVNLGGALEREWLNHEGLGLLHSIDSLIPADSALVNPVKDSIRRFLLGLLDDLGYNNRCNISISAGMNTSVSNNNNTLGYIDFNGDGLPDQLEKYRNGYIIRFNTGNDFGGGMAVLNIDADTDHVSLSTDLSAAITVGFTIGIIPLKIEVNPKGGLSRSLSSTRAQWMDMNADGIPDYVWSAGNDIIGVRYSNLGLANRLSKVTLPTRGTYDIAYRINYDGPRSCGNHYVMSEVTIADNRMVTPNQHMTFRYHDRHYDRRERDDYGYAIVETSEDEIHSGRSDYRHTYRHFLNDNYLFRGLCDTIRISQGDSIYTQNYYNYNLMDIATGQSIGNGPGCYGDGYPAVENEGSLYYNPGDDNYSIKTYRSFEYGSFGNVTHVYDDGDTNDPYDDYTAESIYDSIGDYIVNVVTEESVSGNNDNAYRHRTATYNDKGDIETLLFSTGSGADAEYDFDYDVYGNIQRVTQPANHRGQRYFISYMYDPITHTLPTSITNAYGLSSTTRYDYLWQKPVNSHNSNNAKMRWEYDEKGRIMAIYAPFEYGTSTPTIYYDYKDSSRHNCEYWDDRQLVAYTMNHNDGSQYIRIATISDGLGRPRIVKKDSEVDGVLKRVVSGWKDYDGLGRIVAEWEPTTENINSYDTITQRPDSSMYNTQYSYDVLDRITETILADSSTTSSHYSIKKDATNKWRQLISTTDQNHHVTEQFYDTRNLLTASIGSVFDTTIFRYDAVGQLSQTIDPEGNSTMHYYDDLGRRIRRIHPSAGQTKWDYDPAGNMITQTQNSGESISYEYDYSRPVHISYSHRPWNNVWYKYGAGNGPQAGRIESIQDATGVQALKYDVMGNIVYNRHTYVQPSCPEPLTLSTRWKYDSWGRILKITYPDRESVAYTYGHGGALDGIHGYKPGTVLSTTYIRKLKYNKYGQRTYEMDGDSVETKYRYDPRTCRLTGLWNHSIITNRVLQDNMYVYDGVGNILSIYDNGLNRRTQTYRYDSADRLIHSEGAMRNMNHRSYTTDLNYSPAGRLINKMVNSDRFSTALGYQHIEYDNRYSYGLTNPYAVEHISDGHGVDYDFKWDANGNLVSSLAIATNNTSSLAAATQSERRLCWTEDNRLQAYMEQSRESGIAAYYNYSADGERNIKLTSPRLNIHQNATALDNPTLVYPTLYASSLITLTKHGYTKHYFEEGRRICSKIGGGFSDVNIMEIEEPVHSLVSDYSRQYHLQNEGIQSTFNSCIGTDPRIFEGVNLRRMLVEREIPRDEQEPAFFYHSDHLGSAAYLTCRGDVVQTLNYLPYGEDWVEKNFFHSEDTTRLGIYRFNGKEKDYESGFHYYGARYYWSEVLTGWLSVDPLMDKYPSVSPYNYCILNPVKMIDPNGEDSWEVDENGNVSHLNNKGGENHQIVRYKKTNIERNYYNKEYYRIFNDLMNNSSTYGESEYQEAMANIYLSMANNTNVEWMLQRYNDDTYGLGTVHNSDWSPTPSEITSVYLGESCAKTYKDVITMVHSHPSHDLSSESRRMGYKGINFRGNLEFDGDASMKLKYPWINSYVYFPETRNLWYIKEYNPLWIKKIENFRQLFFGTYNTK